MAEDEVATAPTAAPPDDAPPTVTPAVPPLPATYHVSLWDEGGPAYVCLLCPTNAPHLSLDEVKAHIPRAHDCDAVPTGQIPMLLMLYELSRTNPAPTTLIVPGAQPGEPSQTPPPAEESPDAGAAETHVP